MKLKRLLAGALATCMTLGLCSFARAAEGDTAPKVTVEIAAIKSSKTIEIGLNIENTDNFKSAGAVLAIDNTKLEFIDWTNQVPTAEDKAVVVPEQKAAAWDQFVTIPSKGSDNAAAKPAIAYKDSGKDYIYLGADSFTGAAASGRLVTVRLRLVGDGAWDTLFPKETETPNAWKDTLKGYVTLADKDHGANISPYAAQLTVMDKDGKKTVYAKGAYADGAVDNMEVAFTPDDTIPSAFGGVGGGDAYAVTLLDWDGTILTTATLSKGDAFETELKALVDDTDGVVGKPLTSKPGYDFDCWLDFHKAEALIENDKLVTANNTSLVAENANVSADVAAAIVDTKNIATAVGVGNTGIAMMASYKANQNLILEDNSASSYRENEDARSYLRYGYASANNGKYSVNITVDRNSVERIKRAGVIVQMSPTGETKDSIYSLIRPTNSEHISFELVPTRDMKYVAYAVVDLYDVAAWPNAGSRTGGYKSIDMDEAIREGSISFIIQQAKLGTDSIDWAFVDAQTFSDASGKTFPADKVDALKATLLTQAENLNRENLLQAIDAALAA